VNGVLWSWTLRAEKNDSFLQIVSWENALEPLATSVMHGVGLYAVAAK